jgi:hypothetical protein
MYRPPSGLVYVVVDNKHALALDERVLALCVAEPVSEQSVLDACFQRLVLLREVELDGVLVLAPVDCVFCVELVLPVAHVHNKRRGDRLLEM